MHYETFLGQLLVFEYVIGLNTQHQMIGESFVPITVPATHRMDGSRPLPSKCLQLEVGRLRKTLLLLTSALSLRQLTDFLFLVQLT